MRHSTSSRRARNSRQPAVPAARRQPLTLPPTDLALPAAPGSHTDRIPLVLFCYDLPGQRLLHCNHHCLQVLGYSSSDLLNLGSQLTSRLLHPKALQHYRRQDLPRLLANDRAVQWDCQLRHLNGSWRWLRVRARASAWDASGAATQLSGSAEEVDHHYATTEALQRQRYLLRNLADIAPNFIYIFDLMQRRNLYCNRRIEAMMGYTEAEIQSLGGELIERIMPVAEARRYNRELLRVAQLSNGESRVIEHAAHHRDGSLRWLRCVQMPLDRDGDGQVRTIMGVAEDVTERRAAETRSRAITRRLAEQHRLFRQVIDSLPHPVYLKDGNGNYLLANRATARLYGMTPSQLINPAISSPPPSPDTARYQDQDQQVLASGHELRLEESYTLPDGRRRWFNSVKCLFVRDDGTRQVLGIDSDITRLKNTQLALEAAKEAAEQNARAKQEFLANMSHEIRTPLHGIIGLTGLLTKTRLDPTQQDYLLLLAESAEHLLTVVNDVLTTARLEAGKLEPEALPFSPRQLLLGCAALLRPSAHEKALSLCVDAPDLPPVLGDAHRLRQIVLNLVGNAIKFTERGQVTVGCETRPNPVAGHLQLRFTVADTGIGIAPAALAQVFERFTQATPGTDREYGGSGLGLSISRGLVELMGGELRASSEVGIGSTFSFVLTLPLASEAALAGEQPAASHAEELKAPALLPAGRVLLVEDNPVNSLLTETALRGWGWYVATSATCTEALQLFDKEVFDVVLMDMQLPDSTGEAAARAMRRHPDPGRAATPVIAFTARAQPGEAQRLCAAGFVGYVPKPYREEQLRNALHHALAAAPALPAPASPAPAEPRLPLYDLTMIRHLTRHDEATVRHLAWTFIESTPPILANLDSALARHDWPALSDVAHLLKSSLDGLHVHRLQPVVRAVEQYATRPPDVHTATQAVTQLRSVSEQVMEQLKIEFPA